MHGDGFIPVTKQRFKTPAPDNLFVVNVEVEKHRRDFDRKSILQGVSNDRGDTLLSSEMRYEYAHLEAAKKERNPKLVLPLQYKNDVVKDEKDRVFILVHWLTALYGTMMALLLYYKMFINSLKSKRFKLNPDDTCVTNKQKKGKRKLSTQSSNENELVGGDGIMPIVVWSQNLLMAGYEVAQNIFLQDNRGNMLMEYLRGDHNRPLVLGAERNGKTSSGKRTKHINIRYFFITDRVNMKEISIDWCPTKKMVADYMSKPLQGSLFRELRDYIMGRVRCIRPKSDVISLGQKEVH